MDGLLPTNLYPAEHCTLLPSLQPSLKIIQNKTIGIILLLSHSPPLSLLPLLSLLLLLKQVFQIVFKLHFLFEEFLLSSWNTYYSFMIGSYVL